MPRVARETMPVAPTLRSPLVTVEMVRFEVEAVAEYAMPLAVMLVVEAFENVDLPVTPSVPATDTLPALSIVVVAVAPTASWFAVKMLAKRLVPVALVKASPPFRLKSVVVAFEGKRYAKVLVE